LTVKVEPAIRVPLGAQVFSFTQLHEHVKHKLSFSEMTGYRSSTCRRSRPAVEVQAAKALYNTVDSQSAFKSGHARAAGVAVSERAMAESSGASHNVLLGELSGRDRADAVLARLEATYVNRVSCQQLHFLLRLCQDCAVQCMIQSSACRGVKIVQCRGFIAQRLGTCG
jgi:hypothetical protein